MILKWKNFNTEDKFHTEPKGTITELEDSSGEATQDKADKTMKRQLRDVDNSTCNMYILEDNITENQYLKR